MSDPHDPYGEPTRVDVPVTDQTMAMPAAGGPPSPPTPPPTGEPPADQPDRRGWILAGVFLLVLLIGGAILLLSDDGDDEAAESTTTTSTTVEETTTSSTTSTTEATTTTTEATTTTTPSTVAPAECQPSTDPNDPSPVVQALYEAYRIGDRDCAESLGTGSAVDDLFAIPGGGGGWTEQGCTAMGGGEPVMDCAYTFEGGATHFEVTFSDTDGWIVTGVHQTTD